MFLEEEDDNRFDRKKLKKMPLYQKAMDIFQMVEGLTSMFDEEDEMGKHAAEFIRADAMQIPAKIGGAFGDTLYDIKMENATIIRKCAMSIYVSTNHFRKEDGEFDEYLDSLRAEIRRIQRAIYRLGGWI